MCSKTILRSLNIIYERKVFSEGDSKLTCTDRNDIKTTKTKKTLGDSAFQVASPGLWNGLPNDIRNAKTMDVFKSLVKTHLFRKAYACYFF